MKSKIEFALLFLLGFVLGLVLLASDARAQQFTCDKDMMTGVNTSSIGVVPR